MARPEHHDHGPIRDLRGRGIHLFRQACLRRPEIEPSERVERLSQLRRLAGDKGRKIVEDPLHFRQLGQLCLAPGVAELDCHDRLHEERLAAAGGVVDDPLDAAPSVGADRNHVSPAAQSDERLLQRPRQFAGMDELVQSAAQPLVGHAYGPAQAAQPRGGRVEQVAGWIEATLENAAQARQGVDLVGQVAQERPAIPRQRLSQTRGRLQGEEDVEEVCRVQTSAPRGSLYPGADLLASPDPRARVLRDEGARLGGLFEASGDDHRIRGRLEGLGQVSAGRESGRRGEPGAHQRKLEQRHRAAIHRGAAGGIGAGAVQAGGEGCRGGIGGGGSGSRSLGRAHRHCRPALADTDAFPDAQNRHGLLRQGSGA